MSSKLETHVCFQSRKGAKPGPVRPVVLNRQANKNQARVNRLKDRRTNRKPPGRRCIIDFSKWPLDKG